MKAFQNIFCTLIPKWTDISKNVKKKKSKKSKSFNREQGTVLKLIYSTTKETRFTSLKVMIFYFLLSKRICLCMAIDFAAFSCHNAVRRKSMQNLSKMAKVTKFLLTVSKTNTIKQRNFQCEFSAREFSMMQLTGKRYKTL